MFKRIRKAAKAIKTFFSRKGQTTTVEPTEKKELETVQMKECDATIAVYEVKEKSYIDDPQLYARMCMEFDPGPPHEPLLDTDIDNLYEQDSGDNDDDEAEEGQDST